MCAVSHAEPLCKRTVTGKSQEPSRPQSLFLFLALVRPFLDPSWPLLPHTLITQRTVIGPDTPIPLSPSFFILPGELFTPFDSLDPDRRRVPWIKSCVREGVWFRTFWSPIILEYCMRPSYAPLLAFDPSAYIYILPPRSLSACYRLHSLVNFSL